MEPEFTYQGYMSSEAQDFFGDKVLYEERDGCAVVGAFVKLSNGSTCMPSKGDTFVKGHDGLLMIKTK